MILKEDNLSAVDKMRILNDGGYRNIAAMSDSKLIMNRRICASEHLGIALQKIEAEMIRRGLIPTTTTSLTGTYPSSSISSAPVEEPAEEEAKAEEEKKLLINFNEEIFTDNLFELVKNNINTPDVIFENYTTVYWLVPCLLFAVVIGANDMASKIKQYILANTNCTADELKAMIVDIKSKPEIMARLDAARQSLSECANKNIVEELEKTTPYMLRNDGAFLKCGDIHPYIKMHYNQSTEDVANALLTNYEFLEWFYYNTLNEETKDLICKYLSVCKQTPEIIALKDTIGITNVLTTAEDTEEVLLNKLNDLTNQEFCRARTSNFKYKYGGDNGEIYFRISSKDFNWFDLIYKVVNDHSVFIKFVTIMKDYAATGERFKYLSYKGKEFNKMPIEEFLTLSGNPIVESLPSADLEIDLDLEEDIEKHDTLNPKLWDDGKLKPEVEEKINLIVEEFLEGLKQDDIKIDVKDIIIIGSNCSYNYTKDSDLDIHIIADTSSLDVDTDLYDKLYSAYRSLFNKKIDVEFYNIPIELYIETNGTPRVSNGCYSVLNKKWLKEPVAEDIPEIDKDAFEKEFKVWEDRYFKIVDKAEDKLDEKLSTPQLDQIADFIDDIYELRKNSLAKDGEYSIGNLVFKEVRNRGYLDNLKDLKNQLISQELSLFEDLDLFERLSAQDVKKYRDEIDRLSFNRAIIQDNGLFHIYNVKEDDAMSLVNKLKALDFVEWVQSTAGKFDIMSVARGGIAKRYYTVYGKIKD